VLEAVSKVLKSVGSCWKVLEGFKSVCWCWQEFEGVGKCWKVLEGVERCL